jgi:phosphoribosylglycinamide formyltransferase 1
MAERPPVKLGVLISGRGSNLQAIIDAIECGDLRAEVRIVISNRADAAGLERAKEHRVETAVIDNREFTSREDFDRALRAALTARSVELVICAGFMRLLSRVMLDAFPGRILNTHPALLPAFPGIHGPREALEHGVKIAGCSVFFVTEGIDTGPIIIQAAVPILQADNEETLAARIVAQEHRILPEAIRLYQQDRLKIVGRKVVVEIEGESGETSSALINPPIR